LGPWRNSEQRGRGKTPEVRGADVKRDGHQKKKLLRKHVASCFTRDMLSKEGKRRGRRGEKRVKSRPINPRGEDKKIHVR